MAINTNDGDFEDEIVDEDTVDDQVRETDPDLGIAAASSVRGSVIALSKYPRMPREVEIIQRICADAGLTEDDMRNPRMFCGEGKITLAEYHFESTGDRYLYRIDNSQSSDRRTRYRRIRDKELGRPGPAILLKIDRKTGKKKVVHRWE